MLCDSCDRGWHGMCLSPPILPSQRSKARWTCPTCQSQVTFFDPPNLEEGRQKRAVGAPPNRPVSAMSALGEARDESSARKRRRSTLGAEGSSEGVEIPSMDGSAVAGPSGEGMVVEAEGQRKERKRERKERKRDRKGKGRASDPIPGGRPFANAPWELAGDRDAETGAEETPFKLTFKMTPGGGGSAPRPRQPKQQAPYQPPWMQQQQQPAEVYPPEEEEDEEEDEEPYGGILRGDQASNDGRIPNEEDRIRCVRSREEAEVSLSAHRWSQKLSLTLSHATGQSSTRVSASSHRRCCSDRSVSPRPPSRKWTRSFLLQRSRPLRLPSQRRPQLYTQSRPPILTSRCHSWPSLPHSLSARLASSQHVQLQPRHTRGTQLVCTDGRTAHYQHLGHSIWRV